MSITGLPFVAVETEAQDLQGKEYLNGTEDWRQEGVRMQRLRR